MPTEHNGYGALDLNPYKVHSRREIASLLRAIHEQRQLVRVLMDGIGEASMTTLLEVDEAGDSVIFDVPPDDGVAAHLMRSHNVSFETMLDNIRIVFFATTISTCVHANLPALSMPLPTSLIRLQRREFYRVATPLAAPVRCTIQVMDEESGQPIIFPLQNVSGGGIAILDERRLLDATIGRNYKDCQVFLPGSTVIITTVEIRNLQEIVLDNGKVLNRLGCVFLGLPKPMLAVIQRYITKLEREQNARANGLR